jgi:O-acetylhomoserine (thiol)-lyase
MKKKYHIETLAIHAGQSPDPATLSRAVPIYRTTAYNFKNSEHAANLFALKELGNIYSRLMNPTNDVLEQRLAALEGGAAALTLSSGTAAIYFALTNICKCGDEIVSANNLYGGTFTQFDAILPQNGIKVNFTPVNDFSAVEAAINERTKAIFIETVGNPTLEIADIEGYAKIAQKHKLPLVVDSTFTTPTLLRPIEYGANVVIHSLSKWICGHGTGIGGIVIDAGNFDWTDPKFTLYNEPDRGYHGLRFAHDLGQLNRLAFILRLRTVGLRNQGATLSPDSAWIFLQGVESLTLRMIKHSQNALQVAKFLADHPKVAWVKYPGLADSHLSKKYLPQGAGGMVVFGVRGGSKEAVKLVDNIKLFSLLANVGDAKSLIIHPASTTHSQLSDEDQRKAGLQPELIRLSIGIEHIDDIIGALADALNLI